MTPRTFNIAASRAVLAISVLSSAGCSGVCTGAECASLFDATLIVVHEGNNRITRGMEQSPLDGIFQAVGDTQHGVNWQTIVAPGTLVIGAPDLSQVQSVSARSDSTQLIALTAGVLTGESDSDRFGEAMARAPDITGGGLDELWVGAPGTNGGSNTLQAGAAYLFADLADGWEDASLTASDALLTIRAERAYDQLGSNLAGCEDLDGDRRGDLLLTTAWGDGVNNKGGVAPLAGNVHAILSSELGEDPEERLVSDLTWTWEGTKAGAQLGRSLDCSSNLLGSGLADVVIGAPFAGEDFDEDNTNQIDGAGAVYLLTSPDQWTGNLLNDAVRIFRAEEDETGPESIREGHFGMAVATGDLDGDNRAELIIGATGANDGAGAVYIYEGRYLSLARDPLIINGDFPGDHFGATLEVADLDGDGLKDLVVGAPRASFNNNDVFFASGVVYLFTSEELFGGQGTLQASAALSTFTLNQQFLQLGEGIAVGDFDGEDGADIVFPMQVDLGDLPTSE